MNLDVNEMRKEKSTIEEGDELAARLFDAKDKYEAALIAQEHT